MSHTIKQVFSTLDIKITEQQSLALQHVVMGFEVRKSHALALNSQFLGVYPIVFIESDRDALFEIFDVDEDHLKSLIQKIPSINTEWKVISDAFNLLCIWLIHLSYNDLRDVHQREYFQLNVAKYLHYRFFTSLVNNSFPHGAVERNMQAAIAGLSRKFDIITYGTWKATIEARCKDLISKQSIHLQAFVNAEDDLSFLRILSDSQTRMRDKVKNIARAYYEAHANGNVIASRSATMETDDGKILIHTAKTFDQMIYNLQNEIMTARLFVDNETVRMLTEQFSAVSINMLNSALLSLVEMANDQRDSHQLDLIKVNDGHELYVGIRSLISNIIQKTYRNCMVNNVDVTNKAAVYIRVKNIYSSSRIIDEDIIAIKQSVGYLVDLISTSLRETTKSSLRLCIILYIIVRSFRFG